MMRLTPLGEYSGFDNNTTRQLHALLALVEVGAHLWLAINLGNRELQALPSVYHVSLTLCSPLGLYQMRTFTHIEDIFKLIRLLRVVLFREINLILHLLTRSIPPVALPMPASQLRVHVILSHLFQGQIGKLRFARRADRD